MLQMSHASVDDVSSEVLGKVTMGTEYFKAGAVQECSHISHMHNYFVLFSDQLLHSAIAIAIALLSMAATRQLEFAFGTIGSFPEV